VRWSGRIRGIICSCIASCTGYSGRDRRFETNQSRRSQRATRRGSHLMAGGSQPRNLCRHEHPPNTDWRVSMFCLSALGTTRMSGCGLSGRLSPIYRDSFENKYLRRCSRHCFGGGLLNIVLSSAMSSRRRRKIRHLSGHSHWAKWSCSISSNVGKVLYF
jgi:hypothetical protein